MLHSRARPGLQTRGSHRLDGPLAAVTSPLEDERPGDTDGADVLLMLAAFWNEAEVPACTGASGAAQRTDSLTAGHGAMRGA